MCLLSNSCSTDDDCKGLGEEFTCQEYGDEYVCSDVDLSDDGATRKPVCIGVDDCADGETCQTLAGGNVCSGNGIQQVAIYIGLIFVVVAVVSM